MKRSWTWLTILVAAGLAVASGDAVPIHAEDQQDEATSRIPREPVPSSAIAAVGYSKRLQILEIEFLNGAIYRYTDVPRSVYHQLMSAESKARYYHEHVRGNYPSFRIRKWQTRQVRN